MNLYPYNLYILLITLFIFIIYICLTLKKLAVLAKKGKTTSEKMIHVLYKGNDVATTISSRVETKKVVLAKTIKGLKIYTIWRAIFNDYEKKETKGIKELQSSASYVLQKKQATALANEVLAHMFME